ncbi:MAG: ABC transporter ATP-binding protein [Eubacteriaceae bacterium]|nr:ABC transporter ATP-binding protein [Eubacteriaceae bacterium]
MSDIIIDSLYFNYGDRVIFENYNAVISQNVTTVLMGPSGAGKTTLINLLMGLEIPVSGSIKGVPKRKSAVFQEDRLFEGFSAMANIRAAAGKYADNSRIEQVLDALGIGDEKNKSVSEFSGGMRRRVAIARALCASADIVFMDEPFKGLDEGNKKTVMEYVKAQCLSRTLIIVTHDKEEAAFMGGELLYLG